MRAVREEGGSRWGGALLPPLAALLFAFRVLLVPAYRSTDFEVHRNWLAITHSLPTSEWYYENSSEWTLDYPPLFAWFEFSLSYVAKMFDADMLKVSNLNYASEKTILFQRLSVIFADIVLLLGAKRCCDLFIDSKSKLLIFSFIFGNIGLLMVDHIHFQYNGLLFGMLLLSIGEAIKNNYVLSAFWFIFLVNMKHIYLYIAPAYLIYLLRSYCIASSKESRMITLHSFAFKNFLKLSLVVIGVCFISFAPFYEHIPQIIHRLFPFKRGLCHAYWAPNFWALYNIFDKIIVTIASRFGYKFNIVVGSMTSGLVQEYEHTAVPTITPLSTFLLTFFTMIPILIKLWKLCEDKKRRPLHFIRCITVCGACSFIFGWHVHEKAILMILIPLSLLAASDPYACRMFLILSTVGYYSLFPLLFPSELLPIKVCLLLLHCTVAFSQLPTLYACKKPAPGKLKRLPMLNFLETVYICGLIVLFLYDSIGHSALNLHKTYQFLPLMLTSSYCALGVVYCCSRLYVNFLSLDVFDTDIKLKKSK